MQVICIMAHEWGEKIKVGDQILTIPKDGAPFEVDDDDALRLLQNKNKYRDPSKPIEPNEFNRAPNVSAVMLEDRSTGRILSDEEADEVINAAKADAPAKPAAEDATTDPNELANTEPVSADDTEGEDKGEDEESWPEVSMSSSHTQLVSVATELEAAGYKVETVGKKAKILKSIEAAYKQIEKE